jgi:hypothetical protein
MQKEKQENSDVMPKENETVEEYIDRGYKYFINYCFINKCNKKDPSYYSVDENRLPSEVFPRYGVCDYCFVSATKENKVKYLKQETIKEYLRRKYYTWGFKWQINDGVDMEIKKQIKLNRI